MENVTPPEIDKSDWGRGPWQDEPDRLEWDYIGYPCLMLRNSDMGNWCGYVAIPPTHPYYQKDCYDSNIRVHGGLTYAGQCDGRICHIPKPGEPEKVWWFGFDCAHGGDLVPGYISLGKKLALSMRYFVFDGAVYRDLNYVRNEVYKLARQLKAMESVKNEL